MKLGTLDINSIKIGSADVSKVYVGSNLVYSAGTTPPTPPTPTLQWVEVSDISTVAETPIYGIRGTLDTLSSSFCNEDPIYFEISENDDYMMCYVGDVVDDVRCNPDVFEEDNPCCYEHAYSMDDMEEIIEIVFSDISCSDYYTIASDTGTILTDTVEFLIYQ